MATQISQTFMLGSFTKLINTSQLWFKMDNNGYMHVFLSAERLGGKSPQEILMGSPQSGNTLSIHENKILVESPKLLHYVTIIYYYY